MGTQLLRHDGSRINVEDVREGDLLLGPDGGPRRAFNIVKGKDRLYRISIGSRKEDLVVTPNHILVLHREKSGTNKYDGPTVQGHLQRFEDRFGDLPELSSDPAVASRPNNLVKQCADFTSALKSAAAWVLDAQRSNTSSFATKEDAFSAAVAKSREIHYQAGVTLATLRQRFLDKSADGKGGEIKIDAGLPNVFLLWNKNGSGLKIRVYCARKGAKYARDYAFPLLPGESDENKDSVSEEDDKMTTLARPDVSAAEHYDTVEMTAAQFAALDRAERSKYRLFSAPGFELPEPQVHSFVIKDIVLETDAMEWAGFRVDQDQLYLRHDYLVLHNSGFEGMKHINPLPSTFL